MYSLPSALQYNISAPGPQQIRSKAMNMARSPPIAVLRLMASILPRVSPEAVQQHHDMRLLSITADAGSPNSSKRVKPRSGRSRTTTNHPPAQPAILPEDAAQDAAVDSRQHQLRQLEATLARHRDLYYNQQQAEISDALYDDLVRQYRHLAGLLWGLAPEQVHLPVGAPVSPASTLRKIRHPVPMLSLAAVNSRQELQQWLTKTATRIRPPPPPPPKSPKSTLRSSRRKTHTASAPVTAAAADASVATTAPATASTTAQRWVVEPKVDGLAVRVLYRRTAEGSYTLAEAATRGDGSVGEDVTHNALYGNIAGLPYTLLRPPRVNDGGGGASAGGGDCSSGCGNGVGCGAGGGGGPVVSARAPTHGSSSATGASSGGGAGPEWVEVRGEVFIRASDMEAINKEMTAAGSPPLANPRNAAAGALRLQDPAQCRRRRLSFVPYAALAPRRVGRSGGDGGIDPWDHDGGGGVGALHDSHWDTLEWLKAAGFLVSPDNVLAGGPDEAVAAAEAWMARRANLGYDADGVVIKLDDTTLYETLGNSGSDPRWAVAWKFPAGEAVTRLEGVELAVGRQGQITPVAVLAPVLLGGATIRRASLHNVGRALGLGLHEGDAVVLRRSGDVIPQVVRMIPELRPATARPWFPPSHCPACGSPLRPTPPPAKRTSGAAAEPGEQQLMCDNAECGAKSEKRLLHFATVCLRGSGVSRAVAGQLAGAGLLASIADFYQLDEASLSALPGFGPGRTAALLSTVAASRAMSSAILLQGLNIRSVGEAAAGALGAAFPQLGELGEAEADHIVKAAGVGPAVARQVELWFRSPPNQQLLERLRRAGLRCLRGGGGEGGSSSSSGASSNSGSSSSSSGGGAGDLSPPGNVGSSGGTEAEGEGIDSEGAGGGRGEAGQLLRGLSGVRVCLTGGMKGPSGSGMSRTQLQGHLRQAGAEVHSSVKTTTQLLVMGGRAGHNKAEDAARRGVRVMEEEEFWRQYGNGT